jgi:hypothetical protein
LTKGLTLGTIIRGAIVPIFRENRMEAFIRIGDFTLTVAQTHYPDSPGSHVVAVQDTFKIEGGLEQKSVILPSEGEAVTVVRDYLTLDGPTEDGPFRRYFPEFAP